MRSLTTEVIDSLPSEMAAALPVLQRLTAAGHTAVFVGGCVRDVLLQVPLKDVDLASSASPQEVMDLFPNHIPTGLQHGTVTVRHGGEQYEVTTFRTESGYEDHRRPSDVAFIRDLAGDLERRDFTINAMALHGDGSLEDPYGGREDLRRGIIRAVGDPEARFAEDALRMLRAIRFSAIYGFRPSAKTWRALLRNRDTLKHVAMERVGAELDAMVARGSLARGSAWLQASGLLSHVKEPLMLGAAADNPCGDSRFAAAEKLQDAEHRWHALFILLGLRAETAGSWFRQLRYSRPRRERLEAVLHLHASLEAVGWDKLQRKSWQEAVLNFGQEAAEAWLQLMEKAQDSGLVLFSCSVDAQAPQAAAIRVWMEAMPVRGISDLAVDGSLILGELKARPGPWLGKLLAQLAAEAAQGAVANERQALLLRAAQLYHQSNEKGGLSPS